MINIRYGICTWCFKYKKIMPTKADVDPSVIHKFYIIRPGEFVYNPRTTRMGEKVGLAYNDTDSPLLFTFNNIAFAIKDNAKNTILPTYLYIYFNRSEFDRYAIINSWGSATELFTFEEMCDIDIELPDITIQQKYVNVYNAMLDNQRSYEGGLEDLKLVCDGYVEELGKTHIGVKIGQFIIPSDLRNVEKLDVASVRGISTGKEFIATKADLDSVGLDNYKVVTPGQFAYVPDTSRRGDKISLALNNSEDSYLVSSISTVFETQRDALLPEYLMLFFKRDEFDRYARFHSWGSARETFDWPEMCDVEIPVPDVKIQQYVVNIYLAYQLRKEINEQLKAQIRDLCPILIKGSIEEASA